MTAMGQNSELVLFITHVETDGQLLKIWGQVDRNAATCVERMILPLTEKFAQGLGIPEPGYALPLNQICCACFQNDGYYRAKICSLQPSGNVLVHFIDYGNYEVLPPTALRLLTGIPSALSLQSLPPLALDFILSHVLPVNGMWDAETVESIKQTLRYADLKGMFLTVIGNHRLLKLCYNNEDFGELLVSKNLAVSVALQEMFAPQRQPRLAHLPREVPNYAARSPATNYADPSARHSAPSQEDWRSAQHRQTPAQVPEALMFKSRVLDVGSVHEVCISHVEDGPLKFAIQVKSTEQLLNNLMSEINKYPTAPLQEPPLPGAVCLGRYTTHKVLGRAVVMSVMEQKCKLWFVDYGHTMVLPYSDIFQLPPQYINPRPLAIRFTLSGLKDLVITDTMKEYFKKFVSGKQLVLQVRPPEGPPLIQYGDLYHDRANIRDLMKESGGAPAPVFYQEPPRLQRGGKDIVHISFVESCTKFFVQLDSGVKSLNSIMACLAEYAQNAPQLDVNHLQVGWPCCASYAVDKQWYRAQILSLKGDQVTVLYVDYGNEETVPSSSLCKIHNDLVTNLRSQAIRCVLNGFQSVAFNQEIANQFELLVLEKQLAMEVTEVLPNASIVNLVDGNMVNIASKLQIPNAATRGLNFSNNMHKDNEQALNSSQNSEPKYQSDERNNKWGKNAKPNTWGQENRPGEWSARSTKSQFDHNNHTENKEQFAEKMRSKTGKDVENEQRQRDNCREGEDRLHHKETRNNYFNRNDSGGNRIDRNEDSGARRGGGGRFGSSGASKDDNRFDKNLSCKDDNWSDKDSDTSSRGSGRRGGRGSRGVKGRSDRGGGGRRGERKSSTGRWSDGDSDRGSYKGSQNSGLKKDRNSQNSTWKNAKVQPNKSGSWNSMSPTSPVKDTPRGQKQKIPPPNITVGAVKNAEVIYTDSPTDFYVQLCPDNLELDALMEKIADTYNDGGAIIRSSEIQQGICCIAQYSCDSKWYRAIVKSNNGDGANVHFIDYGNSETVGHDKIKLLQPEFAKLSAQAVHCKLFGATKSTWYDEEIDKFSHTAEGIPLEAEFVSESNGVYEVLLKPTGEDGASNTEYVNKQFCGDTDLIRAKADARNKMKSNGRRTICEVPQYIPVGQQWGNESFAPGFEVDVMVTWFVNPNNFYCQILSKQSEFRIMMNEIQDAYTEQQPIKDILQVGAPVIAFFSDDGALYRAEIKELNKLRGHIVQYVDFGNCAMVDQRKIYPVQKKFTVLSKQAMHCTLINVLPATGNDWSTSNKHEIDKFFDTEKFKCTFHGTKDGKYLITLNNNGRDIGESLIAASLALNPESNRKLANSNVQLAEAILPSKSKEKQDLSIWNGQTIRTAVQNVQGAAKFYIQLPKADGLQSSTTADQTAAQVPLVECYLLNITSTPQIDETFKKSIHEKDVIAHVQNVNNDRFAVQLYDTLGNKVKILDSDMADSISPICPMPICTLTHKVIVTQIQSSENVWLQRLADQDNIAEFLSLLYEHYSVSGSLLVPEVGKLCAAESSDGNWYRAVIESVNETAVVVRFVDYGNSEEISSASIKSLEPQFYVPHQMAIEVSLVVTLKGTEEEQKTVLQQHLGEKEFDATFYKVSDKWLVELAENDQTISETLSVLNLVAEFKDTQPRQPEIPEMIVGNRYEVFLSYSDSPAQFWLQRNEEIDAIEEMQANLQIAAPNFASTTGIAEEGTLCAALYSADSMWYRAEVIDADEDITTVRFIDYGNTDVVTSNSNNIKELPLNWKSVKKYGLKSRLDLIPTGSEDWSTASCEMFENLATSTNAPITALIIADSVPRRVELFVNEKSIGDELVKEGHAIMVHNAEDLIDEIIDLELDPRSAFVSHINSPNEFWVQEEKSVSDLEIMTDRFIVAEMFPKLDIITDDTLCVAKFPDDEQWYRARVISLTNSGTEVLYIDYGNSAVSTEIRTIPEDLAAIPPLSRKCCLELPPGVKEWSDKACDKFVDLAADGATIFLLDVIKDGEISVVNLTLDGVNVANQLTELCNILPVIDERLPPLGEENSPNIVVSHVNSPAEFWTQAESSMSELEIMASRLVDAHSLLALNNFENGTVCAAKFPEDGQWYRAKILSHGDSGTNVLYFDYGNSALTTELRILPEDVANIPSLATRCTLSLPDDVESWSEEACLKFTELVADGVTMFQYEILDNNDPTLITLELEGKNVVDVLKPLCKPKNSMEKHDEQIEPTGSMIIDEAVENQVEKVDKLLEDSTNVINDAVPVCTVETAIGELTFDDKARDTTLVVNATDIVSEFVKEIGELKDNDAMEEITKDLKALETGSDTVPGIETEIGKLTINNDFEDATIVINDEETVSEIEEIQINGSCSPSEGNINATDILEVPEKENIQRNGSHDLCEGNTTEKVQISVTNNLTVDEPALTDIPVSKEVIGSNIAEAQSITNINTAPSENGVMDEPQTGDTSMALAMEKMKTPAVQISQTDIAIDKVELIVPKSEPLSPDPVVEDETQYVVNGTEVLDKLADEDNSRASALSGSVTTSTENPPPVAIKHIETTDVSCEHDLAETTVISTDQITVEKDVPPETTRDNHIIDKTDKLVQGSMTVSTPQKTPKTDKIVPGSISRGSVEDDIPPNVFSRRRSSCTEDKIVPGSINKGADLTQSKSVDVSSQENLTLTPQHIVLKQEPIPVTPSKTQHEDKIVPGSISRGQSPSFEQSQPPTPKTQHSEKLLAGVVTLQENLSEYDEPDEILVVEIENNIPENRT